MAQIPSNDTMYITHSFCLSFTVNREILKSLSENNIG